MVFKRRERVSLSPVGKLRVKTQYFYSKPAAVSTIFFSLIDYTVTPLSLQLIVERTFEAYRGGNGRGEKPF
jgi:hypothetical protein